MRDRLIELIVDAENAIYQEKPYFTDTERIGKVADHLLAEGVIVPPCKVWQKVYIVLQKGKIIERTVHIIVYDGKWFVCDNHGGAWNIDRINHTMFLTREEAEKALAERSENGKS